MPLFGDSFVGEGIHECTQYTSRWDLACKPAERRFSITSSDTYMDGGVAVCPPPRVPLHHRLEGEAIPGERKRGPCPQLLPLPSAHLSGSSQPSAWAWWQQ